MTAEPILALIRKHEARGSYEVVWSGAREKPSALTSMTIGEVIAWQRHTVALGSASSAAGAYQFLRKTLEETYPRAGLTSVDKFSPANQDALAMVLLSQAGLGAWSAGQKSDEAFMLALSRIWASLPVPYDTKGHIRDVKAGQSFYTGDGLNAATCSIAEMRAALAATRSGAPAPVRSAPPVSTPVTPEAAPAPARRLGAGPVVFAIVGAIVGAVAVLFLAR